MAMFIQKTVECNKCHEPYQTETNEGKMSILFNNTYLSICPKCTDEVVKLMGYTKESINKELARINELISEEKIERELRWGERCRGCKAPFERHHHKHMIRHKDPYEKIGVVREYDYYHTSCYQKLKLNENENPNQGKETA